MKGEMGMRKLMNSFSSIIIASVVALSLIAPMSILADDGDQVSNNTNLLPLEGNAGNGKKLFWDKQGKFACAKCHTVDGAGGEIGPELTSVAATRPIGYIAESVLQPSAVIVKGYEPLLIQLKSGERISGVLRKETSDSLTIGMTDGTIKEFARSDIGRSKVLKKSIMPENFAELLSVKEFADLLAYVQTLKGAAQTGGTATKERTEEQQAHSEKVYKLFCTQCHGVTANGKGINAPHLTIQPKNHSNSKEMGSLTDDGIFLAIRNGGAAVGRSPEMPPFGGALSDDDITGLVRHLRKLCDC